MLDVLVAELKTLLNNVLMVFSYSNFLIFYFLFHVYAEAVCLLLLLLLLNIWLFIFMSMHEAVCLLLLFFPNYLPVFFSGYA